MRPFKARPSSAHKLMCAGNEITEKQLLKLNQLLDRDNKSKEGDAKPLTANMKSELNDLVAKRDLPFEFGKTAKKYIKDVWLYRKYKYRELFSSDQTYKGNLCEQDSFDLVSEVYPVKEFRISAKDKYDIWSKTGNKAQKNYLKQIGYNAEIGKISNDYLVGIPDIDLDNPSEIEDVKTSFTISTFSAIEEDTVKMEYYGQGQCYMDITGKKVFRLYYCLVPTPDVILEQQIKKLFFRYGKDESNEDYEKSVEQLLHNNEVIKSIPAKDRVKRFTFDYDEAYINKLKSRIELARDYYKTIKL